MAAPMLQVLSKVPNRFRCCIQLRSFTHCTVSRSAIRRVFKPEKLFSKNRCLPLGRSSTSTQSETNAATSENVEEEEYHSIIKEGETTKGKPDQHEFQAETKKLLDIVAKSLYSEKEVFIRELISNGSDALEKLRYLKMTGASIVDPESPLEIHIAVDYEKNTLVIQDTGLGMNKEELIDNLGVIARSGSKAFLEGLEDKSPADVKQNLIGQFGVGFYSSFMVADKVEVYTKSYKPDSTAYHWTSDGLGSYKIWEAEGVQRGTKIIVHLKKDCTDFAREEHIHDVIKKYSNFVGVPIFLNGKKVNVIQALWTMDQRDISEDMHEEFYRFISKSFDKPRYTLQYKADAPINIQALFYVPEIKPTLWHMSRETEVSVALYSRRILITDKANHILPKWLRFMQGVVDSEDIPLNLSRELLQDSALINKIKWILTNRLLKFFLERSKKEPEKYLKFYEDFGLFLREGIITTNEQPLREDIAKLMRFESSKLDPGVKTGFQEYTMRMPAGGRVIYFLTAPSRALAESSPYYEAMRKKDLEVLFCFEPYDELVLMNLTQFDNKKLKSIENELVEDTTHDRSIDSDATDSLSQDAADDLLGWLRVTLGTRIKTAKITHRLDTHPCIVSVAEMGAARHFLRTSMGERSDEERSKFLQPTLEINPKHPIIKKLHSLKESNSELAKLVSEQLYDNAMIAAGLLEDPRSIVGRVNELLVKALEKH